MMIGNLERIEQEMVSAPEQAVQIIKDALREQYEHEALN